MRDSSGTVQEFQTSKPRLVPMIRQEIRKGLGDDGLLGEKSPSVAVTTSRLALHLSAPVSHQDLNSQDLVSNPVHFPRRSSPPDDLAQKQKKRTYLSAEPNSSPPKRKRQFQTNKDHYQAGESDVADPEEDKEEFPGVTFSSREVKVSEIRDAYEDILRKIQQKGLKQIIKTWIRSCHPLKQGKYPYNGGKASKIEEDFDENNPGRDTAPDYWPPQDRWREGLGCRHREPDHIYIGGKHPQVRFICCSNLTLERLILGIHLLCADDQYNDAKFSINDLENSTIRLTVQSPKDFHWDAELLLKSLYHARRKELQYLDGQISKKEFLPVSYTYAHHSSDGNTLVSVMMPPEGWKKPKGRPRKTVPPKIKVEGSGIRKSPKRNNKPKRRLPSSSLDKEPLKVETPVQSLCLSLEEETDVKSFTAEREASRHSPSPQPDPRIAQYPPRHLKEDSQMEIDGINGSPAEPLKSKKIDSSKMVQFLGTTRQLITNSESRVMVTEAETSSRPSVTSFNYFMPTQLNSRSFSGGMCPSTFCRDKTSLGQQFPNSTETRLGRITTSEPLFPSSLTMTPLHSDVNGLPEYPLGLPFQKCETSSMSSLNTGHPHFTSSQLSSSLPMTLDWPAQNLAYSANQAESETSEPSQNGDFVELGSNLAMNEVVQQNWSDLEDQELAQSYQWPARHRLSTPYAHPYQPQTIAPRSNPTVSRGFLHDQVHSATSSFTSVSSEDTLESATNNSSMSDPYLSPSLRNGSAFLAFGNQS